MDTTKMRVMSCMGIGVVIYWEYQVANISVPPDPPCFYRWVFCCLRWAAGYLSHVSFSNLLPHGNNFTYLLDVALLHQAEISDYGGERVPPERHAPDAQTCVQALQSSAGPHFSGAWSNALHL